MYIGSEKQETSSEFIQGTACKMATQKADVEPERRYQDMSYKLIKSIKLAQKSVQLGLWHKSIKFHIIVVEK
jgi:hypothetical protein